MTFPRRLRFVLLLLFALGPGAGLSSAASPAAAEAGPSPADTTPAGVTPAVARERAEPAPALGEGAIPYDLGAEWRDATGESPDGQARSLGITFFTDCDGGAVLASCGGPPARWDIEQIPVEFCTFQTNRPESITAQQFRDSVEAAADMWTATEVRVGVRYTGDCEDGERWEHGNGRNEIGFDDERAAVVGRAAAVARGTWVNIPAEGPIEDRHFTEFDIVIDEFLDVPLQCFRSVVAHEMGHALGLGHSEDPTDLMFESFDPRRPRNCLFGATEAERARFAELYGDDASPSVAVEPAPIAPATTRISLAATGEDPEDEEVTLEWTQVAGPPTPLIASGGRASFTVPDFPGAVLRFRVHAYDRFLHRASADLILTVAPADSAPAGAATLSALLPPGAPPLLAWKTATGGPRFSVCLLDACDALRERPHDVAPIPAAAPAPPSPSSEPSGDIAAAGPLVPDMQAVVALPVAQVTGDAPDALIG